MQSSRPLKKAKIENQEVQADNVAQASKKEEAAPLNLSSFLQICEHLPEEEKYLIPFMIIHYLFSNHPQEFVKSVASDLKVGNSNETIPFSSCVETAYSTAVIFFGMDQVKKIRHGLTIARSSNVTLKLPTGDDWTYKVRGLFDTNIINELQNNSTNNPNETITKKAINDFNTHMSLFLSKPENKACTGPELIKTLEQYFNEGTKFPFNELINRKIKEDIETNKTKLNAHLSFSYWIAIMHPTNTGKFAYLHVFQIEQTVKGYRIYQSWINLETMLEDFNKRKYDPSGKSFYNHSEIIKFLDNLAIIANPHYDVTARSEAVGVCFGYKPGNNSLNLLHFDKQTLIGMSFRYFSSAFDPSDCIKNVKEFIASKPELNDKFQLTK